MGIGRPADKNNTIDYVLDEFTKAERARLDSFVELAVSCCLLCLEDGVSRAMDQYNTKK
jgi:peptidyl-tRNA hydrolase